MTFLTWLTLASVCCMGAMSPGPSLAVVVHNTLQGGRTNGILTALAHSVGIGIYALLTALGLALIITQTVWLYGLLQYAGAAYLLYMGIRALILKTSPMEEHNGSGGKWWSGFLVAFLNPKVALFFIALFSQFIDPNSSLVDKIIVTLTAACIDAVWYMFVALMLSHSRWVDSLKQKAILLDRIFGLLLIALAARVVVN